MQNTVIDMCEKFHNDWLRNDRALGNGKSDNNNNNNNVCSAWRPVSRSKNCIMAFSNSSTTVVRACACMYVCNNTNYHSENSCERTWSRRRPDQLETSPACPVTTSTPHTMQDSWSLVESGKISSYPVKTTIILSYPSTKDFHVFHVKRDN